MDQELKQQLDRIEKFLFERVVTKEELKQELQTVKEEMATKESINRLTDAVDKFAKTVKDFQDEHNAIKHQLIALQDWARKVSEKLGIEFKL